MKRTAKLAVLVICALSCAESAFGQTAKEFDLQSKSNFLIRDIFSKIKASNEGHPLIGDVDTSGLACAHSPGLINPGWLVRARVEKGSITSKIDHQTQCLYVLTVTSENGIILEVYVAFAGGYAKVETTKVFFISQKPLLAVGYYLLTHRDNPSLRKRIDQIIADDISSGFLFHPKR